MMNPPRSLFFVFLTLIPIAAANPAAAQNALHSFDRVQLSDDYYSEGISTGDLNGDGLADVVYGPFWYAGPDFKTRNVIYGALPQNREGYAKHFFSWVHDFNGDGLGDVLTAGFPGTPAFVYENPGVAGHNEMWPRHTVFDWVSNESPHFIDLIGDDRPELVCTRDGFFGYASPDWEKPFEAWSFHKISEMVAPVRFGHGLGIGDVNGDGRSDLLMKDGWFEQPAVVDGDPLWDFHKVPFAPRGGAEMYAYDVDGDGDSDVITSLAAHEFGLSWFEQTGAASNGDPAFTEHLIMGHRSDQNAYGVLFSELHSVALADIDGDGLKDIVTGKTYWSHHRQSPGWDAGAVVYWFKLVRGADGIDWVPQLADGDAGIGRQVVVADVNADDLPDLLVGGMKGGHLLLHQRRKVDAEAWKAAQPIRQVAVGEQLDTKPAPIDAATGSVPGALEGETMQTLAVSAGELRPQAMGGFKAGRWSGNSQGFWTGAQPGDKLDIELSAPADGSYLLESVFTRARDYAIIHLHLDGEPLGAAIDLFDYPDVTTTGLVERGPLTLTAGAHILTIEISGANPHAEPKHCVGIDFLRLVAWPKK